jgi:pSer/pThr/pTyr-binding forkhead associated (FHA) protein
LSEDVLRHGGKAVPFSLKVTKGPGAGAEFPFDQAEARLGRTADNDIVVKDSGASRAHARVFQKGDRYFVEDLKSANGTKVNGITLNGAMKEVQSGDTITIGEVAFTFTLPEPERHDTAEAQAIAANETVLKNPPFMPDTTAEVPMLDPNATILKPPLAQRQDQERGKPTTRQPSVADDETVPPSRALARAVEAELGRPIGGHNESSTDERPMLQDRNDTSSTNEVPMLNPPSDNVTAEVQMPVLRRHTQGGPRDEDDEVDLTAADKARIRRNAQKSTSGRVRYAWSQLPKVARVALIVVAVLAVLGIGGGVTVAVMPKQKAKLPPEPQELAANAPIIKASFGTGDGVMYERPDMKIFTFNVASAAQIVGVLHYQAKDVSKDEVSISVNGVDLGFVPADTLDAATRELELVLPAQQMKKGEANQLIFDNVHNPPAGDPWRVWNIWLELIAIPDMSPEEMLAAAHEDLERSQKLYETRDVGPDNLFRAWKGYREAWLKMESMLSRPEDLYINARTQMREIRQQLDQRCSMMELEVQKALNQRRPDRKKARQVVEEMLRYFPSREHPCNALARSELEDLGGL